MKRTLTVFFSAALVILCPGSPGAEPETKKPGGQPGGEEKKAEPESRVKHGANGEIFLTLDAETQKRMGLQTVAVAPAELSPELKAYGRVLDISPLASLAADLTTARAAGEASQAELKRLQTLAAQNNASARALEAAQAAAARDQAQVDSARLRLVAGWGIAISEQKDLAGFVRGLGSLSNALVELDVPASDAISGTPTGARLLTLAHPTNPIPAQLLGPASMVDPQLQTRGFLFLISPNSTQLAPGTAVSGFLTLPGEPQSGVALPRDAIVRFNGATWIYSQTDPETFQRVEVKLEVPLESGWFVHEGLKAQTKVVTVGAQQMLSEELKGQGGEQ